MSAWQAHLTKFRASHPKLSMKECMQQASQTYKSPCAAYRGAAPKKKKAGAKRPMTAWMKHVMAHKAKHGGSLGDAMKAAKATYKTK
jgi:hypothetical protein